MIPYFAECNSNKLVQQCTKNGMSIYQQSAVYSPSLVPTFIDRLSVVNIFARVPPVDKKIVHIGRKIDARRIELRYSKADLIRRMGIPRQTFNRILDAVSIDTALLERFNEALECNFFLEYINPDDAMKVAEPSVEYVKRDAISDLMDELEQCKNERSALIEILKSNKPQTHKNGNANANP